MAFGNINLTPQLVQNVRDAADIVDIASEHTKLRKSGRRFSGLCPLHREKTPSFSVDPDQGLFYCFGCGQGGDAIKLHMLLSGDDFPAAIEGLAQRYGIPLPAPDTRAGGRRERDLTVVLDAAAEFFSAQLKRSRSTLEYLEQRQVAPEVIERFDLGFAPDGWRNLLDALHPKYPHRDLLSAGLIARSERAEGKLYDRFRNRLMFPIRSSSGRLVGFGGRTLGDDRAKYINTSETDQFQKGYLLYGLDWAKRDIREAGTALLVEGYFDVIGAVASGVTGTVASMGTALTPEQARLLARFAHEVVVGFDGDAAGDKAFQRAVPELLRHGLTVRRAHFGKDHDPDSLRLEKGPEEVVRSIESATDGVDLELARLVPGDVHSDPGKQARAARRVGDLLKTIPDSVLRYSYCKRASERLGIPVELLWRRLGGDSEDRTEKPDQGPGTSSLVRSMEEKVLQMLLSEEVELPDPEELPPPEAFMIPVCRNIYSSFYDLYRGEAKGRPTVQQVLAGVPHSGREVDQVARLLLEGSFVLRSEELRSSLRQVSRRWQLQRLRGLSSEIAEAQRAGDEARMEQLVQEKTALSQSLHRGSHEKSDNSD